jgi:ornithine decarboxylase
VKCNQDPEVLRLLAKLGTGFDCASKTELKQVLDTGVEPHRIIYANPCKTASYVRYAAENDVRMMTFDNPEELYKIKKFFPGAQLVLRIATDDSKALCRLSIKYGAPLDNTLSLLQLAKELELNVIGVSFHVGSGSYDPSAFAIAVKDARKVFDEAAQVGYDLRTLDVGGGYGNDNFEQIAAVLGPAVDQYFPPGIRIIAEPGRYYVESAFTIATHVIARRTVQEDMMAGQPSYMLYMNDGVYGNFSGILFDHQHPVPKVLKRGSRYYYNSTAKDTQLTKYSVWGPTCDGIDCISKSCFLPEVLEVGDWLYFINMGGLYIRYLMFKAHHANSIDSLLQVLGHQVQRVQR